VEADTEPAFAAGRHNLPGTAVPVKVMKAAPVDAGPPPTGRVHMILPISVLIASAYNLPVGSGSRILGGPDWLRQDIDQFEIQAKIEDSEYAVMQKMTRHSNTSGLR
jgi:hypothetical protein